MAPGLGCRVSGLGFRVLNLWFFGLTVMTLTCFKVVIEVQFVRFRPPTHSSPEYPALLLGYLALHRIEAVSHGRGTGT